MSFLPPYAVVDSPLPLNPDQPIDLLHQSIEVPGSQKPGQTGHYRNARFPNFTTVEAPGKNYPRTAYELFNHGLGKSFEKPCFGHRPVNPVTGDLEAYFVWQTYGDIDRRRTDLGSGLLWLQSEGELGSIGRTGWAVGIWAHNRPEWQITYHACAAYSLAVVSLYETLGPNVEEYCINHAEARVVFASASHIPELLKNAKSYSHLKVIVSMDTWVNLQPVEPKIVSNGDQRRALKVWGEQMGILVFDIEEVEAIGRAHPIAHIPPRPSDMISICYTSGTTGVPKGAILLHRTMAAACLANLHNQVWAKDQEMVLSYLPLSHIYERFFESLTIAVGAPIAFSCGDNLRLLEDLQIAKPTFFTSVPRVLNRIYQAVHAQMSTPGYKSSLARRALNSKLERLRTTGSSTHVVWDRLVFKKVKQVLGGRVRFIASGSAPIAPEVLAFLKVAFVAEVVEGYGSTENCGTCTRCYGADSDPDGAVGPPQVGQEIKLVDVPEMNYFSTDKPYPRGEICIRGEACIPGYYKDEVKTKELIDAEGWQHSGDVGIIDSKGRIKIIDRIKNLLKLSHGEYVALEKIEGIYSLNILIGQVYVHGHSLRSHLIGVVVPEPEAFQAFVSKAVQEAITLEEACLDPKVQKAFLQELEKTADAAHLNGFERIKQIHLTMEPFTIENDLLTPTFKLKRPVAKMRFKEICEKLYEEFEVGQKITLKL